MPRKKRIWYPGAAYHVMSRGNRRTAIYKDEADYCHFLEKIHPELKGMDPDEKENAKRQKKELLDWAKSMGWHRDNSTNFSLL